MKRIYSLLFFMAIELVMFNTVYCASTGNEPQTQGIMERWYNWGSGILSSGSEAVRALPGKLYSYVPRMNFTQWARNLIRKLSDNQKYTLFQQLADALGIKYFQSEEQPIQKSKKEVTLADFFGFQAIDSLNRGVKFDYKNFYNVALFLQLEDEKWPHLQGKVNPEETKCILFRDMVVPVLEMFLTDFSYDIPGVIAMTLRSYPEKFTVGKTAQDYENVIKKYIQNCIKK